VNRPLDTIAAPTLRAPATFTSGSVSAANTDHTWGNAPSSVRGSTRTPATLTPFAGTSTFTSSQNTSNTPTATTAINGRRTPRFAPAGVAATTEA
jgi:hypothetical protein